MTSAEPPVVVAGVGDVVAIPYVWRDWMPAGSARDTIDRSLGARQYAHWRYAEKLVAKDADDIDRGVMMHKLWNAVDGRVRLLFDLYQLRELTRVLGWSGKPRPDHLEILVRLGLMRPLALRKLKSVRNAVEHADEAPPGMDEVASLVDLVWYFLRSTDVLVSTRLIDLEVELEDPTSRFCPSASVTYSMDTWIPTISGWFRPADISDSKSSGLLEVELTRALTRRDEMTWVAGRIRPVGAAFEALVKDYFVHELVDPG